jgi:hypothetical protein
VLAARGPGALGFRVDAGGAERILEGADAICGCSLRGLVVDERRASGPQAPPHGQQPPRDRVMAHASNPFL